MAIRGPDGPLWTSTCNIKQATRFHELLGQLCSEHDQEVAALRQELGRLGREPRQVTSDSALDAMGSQPHQREEHIRPSSACSNRGVLHSQLQPPGCASDPDLSEMEEVDDSNDRSNGKPLVIVPEAPECSPPCAGPAPPQGPPPGLSVSEDPVSSTSHIEAGSSKPASRAASPTPQPEKERKSVDDVRRPGRLSRPGTPPRRPSDGRSGMLPSPRGSLMQQHVDCNLAGFHAQPSTLLTMGTGGGVRESVLSNGSTFNELAPLKSSFNGNAPTERIHRHRNSLAVVGDHSICSRDRSSARGIKRDVEKRRSNVLESLDPEAGEEEPPPPVTPRRNDDCDFSPATSENGDTFDEDNNLKSREKKRDGSYLVTTTEAFSASGDRFSERKSKGERNSLAAVERQNLELHETWADLAADYKEYGVPDLCNPRLLTRKSTHNMRRLVSVREVFLDLHCSARMISSPSSKYRLLWDVLGIVFLGYDLLSVPLQVYAFEEHRVAKIGRYITAAFWSADILASFFVGYHVKGRVEMRPCKVACHYVRSWFMLDVALVATDWAFLLVYSKTSAVRLGKFTRGMRAFRLLRLVKYHVLLADVTTRIRSEYMRTVLSIGKIITFIVFVNHFIACGFYGLHHLDVSGYTWVVKNFETDDLPGRENALYRYYTSVHWSLTQFTPASMEVVPVNSVERAYTVCVLLFALVTFSSFVSSITTAMTHLRHCNARKIEQDSTLRRYLSEHDISPELTSRVLHYFQDRQQQNRRQVRTKEADVELFKVLPDSIKFELRHEAFMPVLQSHPLFHHLMTCDLPALKHICRSAVLEKRLTVHDELFGHGADVTHMLFLTEGVLNYKYPINTLTVCDKIHKGEWACEVALWANGCELFGPFVAESNCELLMLDRTELRFVVEKYPLSAGRVARYGELYIGEVKEVVKRSRWQSVVLNDFDQAQELSHTAFEVNTRMSGTAEGHFRISGRKHSDASAQSGSMTMESSSKSHGLGNFIVSLIGHGRGSQQRGSHRKDEGGASIRSRDSNPITETKSPRGSARFSARGSARGSWRPSFLGGNHRDEGASVNVVPQDRSKEEKKDERRQNVGSVRFLGDDFSQ